MEEQLKIEDLNVFYDNKPYVESIQLSLIKGEIGCLLGPSGCGKTSLLKAIAGFQENVGGEIYIADRLVEGDRMHVPAERRKVGMVFQDIALFPHLNVFENIVFGVPELTRLEKRNLVTELLKLVGLPSKEHSFPHELSGGQQQRIALARAIAPNPELILLDEPFSSLDAELSELMAQEMRNLFKARGITALIVTHDQHEAFAMADKVGVMHQGKLLQWDTPYDLYHRPSNLFVAGFIGDGAIVSAYTNDRGELQNGLGVLAAASHWVSSNGYDILIRPDDIQYQKGSPVTGKVLNKLFRGAVFHYEIELDDGQIVVCEAPSHVDYFVGDQLPIRLDLEHFVVFEKNLNI